MISPERTKAILAAYVAEKASKTIKDVQGRVTEMSCLCGGVLCENRRIFVPTSSPRPHRTKRIRKKWFKKWEQQQKPLRFMCAAMSALQKPHYRCEQCGRTEGFYSAMLRNMFPIQSLPPAAVTFYTTKE